MAPKLGMGPVRRAQILNATLRRIGAGGLDAVTLETVARAAGVSKGVISYYFKGKDQLLLAAFRAFLDMYNHIGSAAIRPDMPVSRMLEVMTDIVFYPESVDPALFKSPSGDIRIPPDKIGRIYFHFLSRTILDAEFQRVMQEMYDIYFRGFVEIIEYGVSREEFRRVDAKAEALSLMALLDGLILYRVFGFSPLGPKVAKHIVRNWIKRMKP